MVSHGLIWLWIVWTQLSFHFGWAFIQNFPSSSSATLTGLLNHAVSSDLPEIVRQANSSTVVDSPQHDSARRKMLQMTTTVSLTVASSTVTGAPLISHAQAPSTLADQSKKEEAPNATLENISSLTVPLQYSSRLDAFLVYFTIGGDRFGAIVDTGSPFLTIPGTLCSSNNSPTAKSSPNNTSSTSTVSRWGCFQPRHSEPVPGLTDTMERFDNAVGRVQWRQAPFAFWNATGSIMVNHPNFVFGVLDESLMSGPGGVFLGLIRDTNPDIRPSFLGQTPVRSMALDLRQQDRGGNEKSLFPSLTLSTRRHIIPESISHRLSMTKILNQQYRDPTIHYTLQATSLKVNGTSLVVDDEEDDDPSLFSRLLPRRRKPPRPIYVIVDTGVSGMVVSSDLYNARYAQARRNRERRLWSQVSLEFTTVTGETVIWEATQPLTTPLGQVPWPGFDAHLVVVGLAFLKNHQLWIEMDEGRLWME